jgi:hypothetical protein
MKSIKLIIIALLFPVALAAQGLDCPSKLASRRVTSPFKFNDLSKSAQCVSGKKYEFMVPLMSGKDYRFTFYADPVFNNQVNFRIFDMSSNKVVLDLPGESADLAKGTCALREYFDNTLRKSVYPYFDIVPTNATTLKIIIDVLAPAPVTGTSDASDQGSFKAPEEKKKGCITVFIQDKPSDEGGF